MPTVFGQFELLENIGSGSMAELFKARHAHDDGPVVVLKRVRPEFRYDTTLMARFVEGAQSVVGLEHPNIATVLDAGVLVGRYYVALEHIDGRDIRHIQKRFQATRRAFPIPLAVYAMTEVLRGLEFAHNAKDSDGKPLEIVHCDVSTQNVMISFDGAVKLINLEGAWFRREGWAPVKGKFAYMSPEQAANEDIDRRSDIFSAGIVFWEIATGQRLFDDEEDVLVREMVEKCDIVPPTKVNRLVPKELEEMILRALAKDPADRYQTAGEMLDALEAFVEKSKLTFSGKQLAGWMKMTFGEEDEEKKKAKAQSKAAPKEEAKAAPKPKPPQATPEQVAAPKVGLPPDLGEGDDEDDDLDEDEATRIDPTSEMMAGLEHDQGEEGGDRSVQVVSLDEVGFDPEDRTPSVDVTPPSMDPESYTEPSRPSFAGLIDDPTLPGNKYLDEAMAERRAVEPLASVAKKKAREAVVPDKRSTTEELAQLTSTERNARIDMALKERRRMQRLTSEQNVHLRFERPSNANVEIDERNSMLQILIIVGLVLALGLGVLAYMVLNAEEPTADDRVGLSAPPASGLLASGPPAARRGGPATPA